MRTTVSSSFALLSVGRPASYQGSPNSKTAYKNRLQSCYNRNYVGKMTAKQLYGQVFHFYKQDLMLDADNISKPTWDALVGLAFDDDRQITVRSAASIDLNVNDMMVVDMDNIPDDVVYDFMDSILSNDHTVYVECGEINSYQELFNQSKLWK